MPVNTKQVKLIKKLISESLLKSVFFRNNADAKTLINVKLLNVCTNKIKYKDETKLKN